MPFLPEDPRKKKIFLGVAAGISVTVVIAIVLILVFVVFADDTADAAADVSDVSKAAEVAKTSPEAVKAATAAKPAGTAGTAMPSSPSLPLSVSSASSPDFGESLPPMMDSSAKMEVPSGESIILTTKPSEAKEMVPTTPVTVSDPIKVGGSTIGVVESKPVPTPANRILSRKIIPTRSGPVELRKTTEGWEFTTRSSGKKTYKNEQKAIAEIFKMYGMPGPAPQPKTPGAVPKMYGKPPTPLPQVVKAPTLPVSAPKPLSPPMPPKFQGPKGMPPMPMPPKFQGPKGMPMPPKFQAPKGIPPPPMPMPPKFQGPKVMPPQPMPPKFQAPKVMPPPMPMPPKFQAPKVMPPPMPVPMPPKKFPVSPVPPKLQAPKPFVPPPMPVPPKLQAPTVVCNIDDIKSAKDFYNKSRAKKSLFTYDNQTKISKVSSEKGKKTCSVSFNNTDLFNGKKSYITKRFDYVYAAGKWLPVGHN